MNYLRLMLALMVVFLFNGCTKKEYIKVPCTYPKLIVPKCPAINFTYSVKGNKIIMDKKQFIRNVGVCKKIKKICKLQIEQAKDINELYKHDSKNK